MRWGALCLPSSWGQPHTGCSPQSLCAAPRADAASHAGAPGRAGRCVRRRATRRPRRVPMAGGRTARDAPQVAGADEPYVADDRCKACLRFVHAIHPALKQHVSSGARIPPGYWEHAIRKVCPAGSDCEKSFVVPYGVDIALGLEDLHDGADGDASAAPASASAAHGGERGSQAIPRSRARCVCSRSSADRRAPAPAAVGAPPPSQKKGAGTSRSRGPVPRTSPAGPAPAHRPATRTRRHPRRRTQVRGRARRARAVVTHPAGGVCMSNAPSDVVLGVETMPGNRGTCPGHPHRKFTERTKSGS